MNMHINEDRVKYFDLLEYVSKIKVSDKVLFHLKETNENFEEYLKVLRLYVKAKGRTKEASVQIKLYKQMLQRYGEYINRDTTITFGKKYRDVRKNMWKTQVKKVAKKILHK
mgnify:CR=1 FL=1